ncbi:MAG TPA: glycosyltransferase family 2 protein [Planctomycetota bacterium]|nr:glycosyltransferase family 2 protein [Planctomycetota bacterium]
MTVSPLPQPSSAVLSVRALESAKVSPLVEAPSISCVIPACNESANLRLLIPQLAETLATLTDRFEIVVVDDGSTDDSAATLVGLRENFPVKCVFLSRNFGKEAALTAGIDEATGDVVVLMDADFQHPVSLIPEFIAKWREGYEMVYGVLKDRAHESFVKRTLTRAFYTLLSKVARIPIQPDAGDFRLLDRKVVESLKALPERNRFMKGLYAWVGYKSIAVPFQVEERRTGRSKFKYRHLTRLALAGMISFSELPLRLSAIAGLLISLVSMSYGLYILVRTLIFGADLPGWATLVVAITFLNGIQLLAIGVVGEYIASIFNEVKGRPNYVIARRLGLQGPRPKVQGPTSAD